MFVCQAKEKQKAHRHLHHSLRGGAAASNSREGTMSRHGDGGSGGDGNGAAVGVAVVMGMVVWKVSSSTQ